MSDSTRSVVRGLDALRRDNPWPEPVNAFPFRVSLDGGGREIITRLIDRIHIGLMVEIGSFLCGSTLQWLEASPSMNVIGIDPWDGNWGPYLRDLAANPARSKAFEVITQAESIIKQVEDFGNFSCALNNVRVFRRRFIPVRRFSPEALHYLHKRDIHPDMIYIDAFKEADDLYVAHELFPEAVLCGDDWNWRDQNGEYKMQNNVKQFARDKGFYIKADRATWVLSKTPFTD